MTLIQKELTLSNKYKLTVITGTELVELTPKNVAIVEAMLRNDSSTLKSFDKKAAPKGKYKGSTAYWMTQLKNALQDTSSIQDEIYKNIITEAVAAVDRENSTHLNADGIGREEITNRLYRIDKQLFMSYLKNPDKTKFELISIISDKTNPTGTNSKGKEYKGRTNISFASKFCHYACYYLFEGEEEQDNYSIYDNILSKAIPLYVDHYGLKNCELNTYSKYRDTIDAIIKNSKTAISRNGFDHLLWYYFRGRL